MTLLMQVSNTRWLVGGAKRQLAVVRWAGRPVVAPMVASTVPTTTSSPWSAKSMSTDTKVSDSNTEFKNTIATLSQDGIYTVTMDRPKTLNAWTEPMMYELQEHFHRASTNDDIRVVILTGRGKYYCAGVNLSGMIRPMHPATLHEVIRSKNQLLFDMFLNLDKPMIAAVNGPAIGASVTSAALCDAIVASEKATFSTPFARLGVPPEGCSSVHFPRILGEDVAHRMMGPEAWVPTAVEAKELGLVHTVVVEDDDDDPGEDSSEDSPVVVASKELARQWITQNKPREIGPLRGGPDVAREYKQVNAEESVRLADCFLGVDFLEGQRAFLSSKGKTGPAMVFAALKWTRPLWGMLLPAPSQKA